MEKHIKREVRPLKPENMDDYISIYLNAYQANKNTGEEGRKKYKTRNLESLNDFGDVNFFGLFEGDTLIAIMKLIDFSMNFFGKMKKATGLMSLGVHPMHKKRGAALEMVKFFEKYTVESGGLVCMLLPFRMDFYRKMGYGCGSKLDEYHIKTTQLPECPKGEMSNLRLLTAEDFEDVLACHSACVKHNHGMVEKFGEELRDIRDDDETRRIGYFRGNKLTGYAAFKFVSTSDVNYTLNALDVSELVYDDGHTLNVLLGGLRLQNDLAQTAIIRTGEPDFYHLLVTPQNVSRNYIDFGFLETNISAVGTMYKICDIPRFINETSHRKFFPTDVKIGFEIYDEMKGTSQHYTIAFEKSEDNKFSTWKISERADCELVCVSGRLSDISSLFMGSGELGSMVRTGTLSVSDESFANMLDCLFHCNQKPFTNTDY